ncbi:MAG TPA: hypothetical protein DCZ20_03330 [Lachnospiraceae bacterium]|nr:hypothetical protein [Lachnospiraceae bacterium]
MEFVKRKSLDIKQVGLDILVDIAGGILIAVGVYNFASAAGFPMTGFSGIALIFYHLFHTPIGMVSVLMNIPIAFFCYRILGKDFFIRSIKTIIITSFIMDKIAPLFPLYQGDRLLAAICTGILGGLGYALIYMRGSSTGGSDFIIMSLKAKNPHMSLGKICFLSDFVIIMAGAYIYREIDGIIYGLIVSYLMSMVVDKVMYGMDSGKMTLIVTEHGAEVAEAIDAIAGRGSTLLHAEGSFSGEQKKVVMCACNNKQMYAIRQTAKKVDPEAFIVIMESNEVLGEGFKTE